MTGFSFFSSKPPSVKQLSLKRYLINLSLDRLVIGIDGKHIDVHISPQVHSTIQRMISDSMIRHSHSENIFYDRRKDRRENEKNALNKICTEILLEGIYRAKSESEVQIDFLGQVALAKLILEEVQNEYRKLIARFETSIRNYELSVHFEQNECFKMKEKLSEIKNNQNRIIRLAGEELFQVFADVHAMTLKHVRESNFSPEHILPGNFFDNPTIHYDDVGDDFLLADAYVLFSRRSDEPDNYNRLKSIIDGLLGKTDLAQDNDADSDRTKHEDKEAGISSADGNELEPWLMEINNIDLICNCFNTRAQYKEAKRKKQSKVVLIELKSWMKIQKKFLNLFYGKFKRARLLELIVAAYELQPVYLGYCPPLRPTQIREYLTKPRSRKAIISELKRRKYKDNTLAALRQTIRRVDACSTRNKKEFLLKFLKDFLRYHRDLENRRLFKQAMETINLITDEKMLLLSKKNRLLYEYLLPEERVKEEKPIISHVILKADIRGSTNLTHMMRVRGLNPASYFSLNFFDPISEILNDYDASKVFIEGDAIILSIFENEDTAEGWYSVARACGLAAKMLQIVREYNAKNQEYDLPALELGIGICYLQSPPAFLFDGESRIMISHAINLADRLSSCDKKLRKQFINQERLFNLSVFQYVRDEDLEATADDLSLRYNVNGIELDPKGFDKLAREINLKSVTYPTGNNETITLYTGTVPTVKGNFQRLVIREAPILKVNPESMDVMGATSRKYYEVCTHRAIYEFIDKTVSVPPQ